MQATVNGMRSPPDDDAFTVRTGCRQAPAGGSRAGDGSGLTSQPAGLILPSMRKPQLSIAVAEVNSVPGTACSSVTMSVCPFRLAMPT